MKNRNNIEDFLFESHGKSLKNNKEHTLFGTILVSVIDPLPENVDIRRVLDRIVDAIPEHLVFGIDSIYIEHLEDFDERNINALYRDQTIYVSNFQDNEEDMIDDIVHEIAHSVESLYNMAIYQDQSLVNEFLGKKKRLLDLLEQEGYNVNEEEYSNVQFSKQYDDFLYKQVGYPKVSGLTKGLFLSPYAITSIREYFARGFEHYFLKNDKKYLIKLCPQLYYKIDQMFDSINSGE